MFELGCCCFVLILGGTAAASTGNLGKLIRNQVSNEMKGYYLWLVKTVNSARNHFAQTK